MHMQLQASSKRAAAIGLQDVCKVYDKTEVIPPLTVELNAGEFTVILGPSGCGKSTLLQLIAGLERVSSGRIFIDGRAVQDWEPKQRGCAMVFQNYALYPHMSVFANMAYSLRIAGVPKCGQLERVQRVADMLGLSDCLDRKPHQLSGGQRQRVAIGRAIVREPSVLLLDEPLSNLDAQRRHDTRIELAELHRRIGATTVFVARFIGAPPMNILPVMGDGAHLRLADGQPLARSGAKGDLLLGIRPEGISVRPGDAVTQSLTARILHREDLGSHSIVTAELAPSVPLRIALPFGMDTDPRADLPITLPPKRLHLFDAISGRALPNAFHFA